MTDLKVSHPTAKKNKSFRYLQRVTMLNCAVASIFFLSGMFLEHTVVPTIIFYFFSAVLLASMLAYILYIHMTKRLDGYIFKSSLLFSTQIAAIIFAQTSFDMPPETSAKELVIVGIFSFFVFSGMLFLGSRFLMAFKGNSRIE